jgi:hypothetical protein
MYTHMYVIHMYTHMYAMLYQCSLIHTLSSTLTWLLLLLSFFLSFAFQPKCQRQVGADAYPLTLFPMGGAYGPPTGFWPKIKKLARAEGPVFWVP